MAKLKQGEKRVQLSFQRPEDLRLWAFLEKRAYECRWNLDTFMLASQTEAFYDKMEDDEVESIAAEAAQKVRERTAVAVPEPPPMPVAPPPAKPQPVSMERALNDAEAQIAALDQVAVKAMGKRVVRKGVPSPPPMPQ
ncbi:MAG: hypothetical protein ACLPND_00275 [Candidatus Korobacteraceae bacterium]